MKLFKLLPLVALLGACSTVQVGPKSQPSTPVKTEVPPRISTTINPNRPNNWLVERKVNGSDVYTIARSAETTKFMWLTCKREQTGRRALSLGIVQPDEIGYKDDDAILVFMVDGREVIFGRGLMVNNSNAGLRSYDPRTDSSIDAVERDIQISVWWQDEARIAQYEVIKQMIDGEFIEAEIKLVGIRRNITVDLNGFVESAHQVITACNAAL